MSSESRKWTIAVLLSLSLAAGLFLPICGVIAYFADYRLVFHSVWLVPSIGIILSNFSELFYRKEERPARIVIVLSAILLPVTAVDLVLFAIRPPDGWTIAFSILFLAGAILRFLQNRFETDFCGLRRICVILAVLVGVAALVLLPMAWFGHLLIGEGTVVRSLDSPQGGYTAQVVSDDQGAMGGNTRVQTVRPARTVNLLFLTLEDAPQEIWTGEYSVSASLPLEWQDENTLLIAGEAYSVSQKG